MSQPIFALSLLSLPRLAKRAIALSVDMGLCVLTVWLAFVLRLDQWVSIAGSDYWAEGLVLASSISVAIAVPIFIVSGLYRAIFRYSGWPALMTVVRAIGMYSMAFFFIFTVVGVPSVPRTVGVIQPLLLLLAVGCTRGIVRFWLGDRYQTILQRALRPKVLVYGAGTTGRQLVAAMANSHEMQVVGFLDDDVRMQGQVLNGMPIYPVVDLALLIQQLGVKHVLLAMPNIGRSRRNEILNQLAPYKVAVRTLPSLNDLAQGRVNVSDIRDLDVDDLLGRETVLPSETLLKKNILDKTVLVTGAGGSIGSELCRQILKAQPKRLILVEANEFALYQIHQELQGLFAEPTIWNEDLTGDMTAQAGLAPPPVELIPVLASVCDEARMNDMMLAWRPDTVYHAAAYKHVPLVEHNAAEGVRNNVWGTLYCAQSAIKAGVANFVLVSTDKAVRPTNIMGASKRLAEKVLQALHQRQRCQQKEHVNGQTDGTIFSMVRFGNVLGSSGSVVPLFRQQIQNGGPVTLTHRAITRYFMTIPEAAELVIQAGAMGVGGDVFVLDMGEPVKIMDLARRMIELSGLSVKDEFNADGDIEIKVSGLRPGEKLFEEMLIGDNPMQTQHPRILKAHDNFIAWEQLEPALNNLMDVVKNNQIPQLRHLMQELVSGYQPHSNIVDWVFLAKKNLLKSSIDDH
jgi:FlaA1/EpsC-like NDP-sugar epimerase